MQTGDLLNSVYYVPNKANLDLPTLHSGQDGRRSGESGRQIDHKAAHLTACMMEMILQ